MLFISFFQWWYRDGWRQCAQRMSTRLDGVIDYFSIDLLLRTLFQPFRQDSSGKVDGALSVKLRALADNLISRVLGAIIRLVILIFGIITIVCNALIALIALIGWAVVPLMPVLGVFGMLTGVFG
ncbi:MAG: hypothetical protein WAS27_00935 [Candidatus Saccharimonadales bacterium]